MRKQEKKVNQIWNAVKEHIYRNLKQYMIVCIFFFIGIIAGVIFVNHSEEEVKQQIGGYITTFIECLKTGCQIDSMHLLKTVIGNHILFALLLWFMGCTVIGIPVVYGLIIYRGFALGYTISSILYILGLGKGSLFCILSLLLQNLLIIPSILALAVSGIKLYQAITKDKKRENIKIEIIRHTIFSLFMVFILMIASVVEVYLSNFLLSLCIFYF